MTRINKERMTREVPRKLRSTKNELEQKSSAVRLQADGDVETAALLANAEKEAQLLEHLAKFCELHCQYRERRADASSTYEAYTALDSQVRANPTAAADWVSMMDSRSVWMKEDMINNRCLTW